MTGPADRMGPPPGAGRGGVSLHAAASLPWLAPSARSLAAWCRTPSLSAWHQTLRHDPGAVLLLLRSSPITLDEPFPGPALDALAPLEFASRLLAGPPRGFLDRSDDRAAPLLRLVRFLATAARELVQRSGQGNPEMAWSAGLLASLGWMAAFAESPARAADCLADPALARDPAATQRRHLGFDVSALTRRLARAWQLPGWLSAILGQLDLPLEHARRLGADPVLFAAVRLALDAARRAGLESGLATGTDFTIEAQLLGPIPPVTVEDTSPPSDNPYYQPLLLDLLAVALERGRLRRAPVLARLEQEADALHQALCEQVRTESARLREAKLSALAEFAAGAGHEINNPLAVISGQAQYLLHHERDWLASDTEGKARESLQTIISQTRRIHSILRDLMQFARPAQPRCHSFDLPTLLGEVVASLTEVAQAKQSRVEIAAPDQLPIWADGEQVRQSLACLLRNAIEAAAGGWARLSVHASGDRVEVWVEDSGPGPNAEQRTHLFDPFYSGRSAGRGKGLGLPVAWRLARQQGGDVYLEPPREGVPTRFVLALPAPSSGREAA